ncbi:MAG: tRNA threonylcarbamoyladenosine dehydratase [Ruminococcaceae bacterium]|nr:tRNA threonylcarbamoyladenosine dehydratase [Oscillospiraceae bacterium]
MREEDSRTAMLLGTAALERLKHSRVAVFGIGGVGSYICEALARVGVGALDLFDSDTVSLSNINRQLVALHSTVGLPKTEVMAARIRDINPDCRVTVHSVFYLPENAALFPLDGYDYIADAIDTVSAKIELAVRARDAGVPLISSMGTGNKLDPSRLCVTDLSKTEGCPLARVMRRELRARGITHQKVVYSPEPARPHPEDAPIPTAGRTRIPPASVSFVPSVAGLMIAGEIVKDLSDIK